MRTTTIMRTAVAVGGVAAALSLSACDGITINFGEEGQGTTGSEPSGDPGAGTAENEAAGGSDAGGDAGGGDTAGGDTAGGGTAGGDSTGGDSSGADAAGGDTGGDGTGGGGGTTGGEGSGTDTSGGGSGDATAEQDAGFTLDENGSGEIPQAMLEEDIVQAYADQGTTVDSVECFGGMHVYNKSGSQSCDVVVNGEEYYGVVKVTDVVGQNVYYKLEFAGIDF
ncbi:MAG TPA: hypothetical protein VK039_09680 [Brevibacterium sp.]|nr:hypothetical protein [Brevibacterium sp.]